MPLLSEERVTSLDPVFGPMGVDAGRTIWARPELTMREKAVLLVAADVAVPELGLPFELHVGMGLTQAALSVEELREVLRHIAPDAGYNITAMAFERLIEVAGELGHDTRSRGHRGGGEARSPYPGAVLDDLRRLDDDFAAYVDAQGRELWSRPGLTARERAIATLAVDIVRGTLGAPFEAHLAVADRVGLSAHDLRVVVRIVAEYSIPRAWEALVVLSRRSPQK
ncbi:MAG: carboxymuconolactone decarboxylase family protein [Gemmatimonadaceae bacterium]